MGDANLAGPVKDSAEISKRLAIRHMPEKAAGLPYPAKLKVDTWQIVIPTTTKITPICLNSEFRSKAEAEAWIESAQGRSLLAVAQRTGRIPKP
jgi:hypothetical protein